MPPRPAAPPHASTRRTAAALVVCGAGACLTALVVDRRGGQATRDGAPMVVQAVVVAVRGLPAGRPIAAADVALRDVPVSAVTATAEHEVGSVVGMVPVTDIAAAAPLSPTMLRSAFGRVPAGQLLVRLTADEGGLAPDVVAGVSVAVVATVDGAAPAATVRRVVVVARCLVTALERAAAPRGGADLVAPTVTGHGETARVTATLQCDARDALRVLWAADYGRAVRLLAWRPGDIVPAAAEVA